MRKLAAAMASTSPQVQHGNGNRQQRVHTKAQDPRLQGSETGFYSLESVLQAVAVSLSTALREGHGSARSFFIPPAGCIAQHEA